MITNHPIITFAQQVGERYAASPGLIVRVLRQMGAERIQEAVGEIRCTCPIHQGSNPCGFQIWFDDEGQPRWECFTGDCGYGYLPKLVQLKWGGSFTQAVNHLAALAGLPGWAGGPVNVTPLTHYQIEELDIARERREREREETPEVFPEWMLQESMRYRVPYYQGRGFTQAILDQFEVGFVPARAFVKPSAKFPGKLTGWFEDRVSIPIRDKDGRLIGFDGRRLDGEEANKYMVLAGTRKTATLYGLQRPWVVDAIRRTGQAILVEGYCDCWRGYELGVCNVVGLCGKVIHRPQLALLHELRVRNVVVYLDGDPPGVAGAQVVANKLLDMAVASVRVAHLPPGEGENKHDPGGARTQEEFLRPIREATAPDPFES